MTAHLLTLIGYGQLTTITLSSALGHRGHMVSTAIPSPINLETLAEIKLICLARLVLSELMLDSHWKLYYLSFPMLSI